MPTTPRVVKTTLVYQGRIISLFREVLAWRHHHFARETIRHPGAVVIVAFSDTAHVVLVRQYRHAVGRYLLEFPAGTLDAGETRTQCARRELEEETGWSAERVERIGQFFAAPGVLSEQLTLFVASGLTRVTARPEPDELLQSFITPFKSVISKVRTGVICDAKSIIGALLMRDLLAQKRLKWKRGLCTLIA